MQPPDTIKLVTGPTRGCGHTAQGERQKLRASYFYKTKKRKKSVVRAEKGGRKDLPYVLTGRPLRDAVCFLEICFLLSPVGCVIQTKTGRDKNSQCRPRPHPPLGGSWRCRGDLVSAGHSLHYSPLGALLPPSVFPPFREVPEGKERTSPTNTQNPSAGRTPQPGEGMGLLPAQSGKRGRAGLAAQVEV